MADIEDRRRDDLLAACAGYGEFGVGGEGLASRLYGLQ